MVEPTMDPMSWLRKHLAAVHPDLLREMVKTFSEQLMSAEAFYAALGPERCEVVLPYPDGPPDR